MTQKEIVSYAGKHTPTSRQPVSSKVNKQEPKWEPQTCEVFLLTLKDCVGEVATAQAENHFSWLQLLWCIGGNLTKTAHLNHHHELDELNKIATKSRKVCSRSNGRHKPRYASPGEDAQESDLLSQTGAAPDWKFGGCPCQGDTECFGEKAERGFLWSNLAKWLGAENKNLIFYPVLFCVHRKQNSLSLVLKAYLSASLCSRALLLGKEVEQLLLIILQWVNWAV